MSDHDISKMKVADLKKELKNRGLSTLGNKNELVDRLQNAIIDGADPLEDTANSEDLLEDDELNDDILEEEEEKHATEEDRMLKSPTPSEPSKSESPDQKAQEAASKEQSDKKEEQSSVPHKKVALKRNVSISVAAPVVAPAAAPATTASGSAEPETEAKKDPEQKNGSESASGEPEKKIIKLTELTAQERLEMRAKKFGAQAATAGGGGGSDSKDKLQARAARFGLAGSDSSSAAGTKPTTDLVSLDALKKRAERFGGSVSGKMTKLEQDEKLQKRQERFGAGATVAAAPKVTATGKVAITAGSTTTTDYAERARLRLERFKNTA